MYYKKSAVDLTDLAIGILMLGIVVTIGATIIINMRNTQIENTAVSTVHNETITPTTSGASLDNIWVKGLTSVVNASNGGQSIGAGNYSFSVDSGTGVGTISNLTATAGTSWNITYTKYDVTDSRYVLPDKAALGIGEYGNWFKIIVIVGVAAVVLSIIFLAFGNKSQGGMPY